MSWTKTNLHSSAVASPGYQFPITTTTTSRSSNSSSDNVTTSTSNNTHFLTQNVFVGSIDVSNGVSDVRVTKLTARGDVVESKTFGSEGNDEVSSSSSSVSSSSVFFTGTTSGSELPCVEPLRCELPHGLLCGCSETANGTSAFLLDLAPQNLNESHFVRFGSSLSNVAVDITAAENLERSDTSAVIFVTGTYHVGRGGALFAPLRGLGDRPDWVMTPTPYLVADAKERYERATKFAQQNTQQNNFRIFNESEIPAKADIFLARFVKDPSSTSASSTLRMTYLVGVGSPAVEGAAAVRVHNEYVYVVGHSNAVDSLEYGFTPGEFERDIAWRVGRNSSLSFSRDPTCDALRNDNIPLRPTRLDPSEYAYGNFDILVSLFLKGNDEADECGGVLQRSILFGTSGNDRAVSAAVGTFAGGDFCNPPGDSSRGMGCLIVVGYTDDPFVSCRSTDRLSLSESCNDGATWNYNTFVAVVRMWDAQRPVVFLNAFGGPQSDEYPLAAVVRRLYGTSQTLIVSGLSNGGMADCLEIEGPSSRRCGKYDVTLLAFEVSDIIARGSIDGHELVENAAFRFGYEGDDLSGGGLEVLIADQGVDEARVLLVGAEAMSPVQCAEVGLSCANLAEEDVDSDLVLSVLSDLRCPQGRSPSTTSSGLFCDRCPIGTFSRDGNTCDTCPDGTTCRVEEPVRDGGFMVSGSHAMEPLDGFYIFDLESRATQKCLVDHFGTQRCVASGCARGFKSYDAYNVEGNDDSDTALSTWLCRVCDSDVTALQSSGTCESCSTNSPHAVVIRFACFFLLFFLARYLIRYFRRQLLQTLVWIASAYILLSDTLWKYGCGRLVSAVSIFTPFSPATANSRSSSSAATNEGDVESSGAVVRESRIAVNAGSASSTRPKTRNDRAVAVITRMTGISGLKNELMSSTRAIALKKSKRESRRARRARAMSRAGTKRPETKEDEQHVEKARNDRQSARMWRKIRAKKRTQIRYASFALVKTILFHAHLMNSIVEVYYVRWSVALRYVYSVFDFVNIHLAITSGVSCYGFDLGLWGLLACAFGVPSLLWLVCTVYEFFSTCYEYCVPQDVGQTKHRRLQMKTRRRKRRRWFLANSILVPAWLFLYVPTSRIALRTFLCIPVNGEVDSTEWRLDMDARILCYDETYSNTIMVLGIAAIVLFALGTPLYYYVVLRYKLVEVEIATNTADRKAAENYARLLYEEYRDYSPMRVPESENHNYYQCIFDCGRMLMLTTLPLLMFRHHEMQLYLGIALSMPILFEHFYGVLTETSPLASPVVRYFRSFSLVLYFATLVGGLLLTQGRVDGDGLDGTLLETALLLAHLIWIVGMISTFAIILEGYDLDAWFSSAGPASDVEADDLIRRQGKAIVRNRYTQKLYSENEEALKADSRVQRRKLVALGVEGRRAQRGNNKKQGATNAPQVEATRIAKQLELDGGSMGKLSEEVRQQKIKRDHLTNEIMHLRSDLEEIESRMKRAAEKHSNWKK